MIHISPLTWFNGIDTLKANVLFTVITSVNSSRDVNLYKLYLNKQVLDLITHFKLEDNKTLNCCVAYGRGLLVLLILKRVKLDWPKSILSYVIFYTALIKKKNKNVSSIMSVFNFRVSLNLL